MRRPASLSPAARERFAALQLEMDEGGPYERFRHRERERARMRRERLRMFALPILITLTLLLAVAFGALLPTPEQPMPPHGDAIGAPEPIEIPAPTPAVLDVRAEAAAAAAREEIPPGLIEAVIFIESRWQVDAVGAAGERGLMQLMPRTARSLGVDPHDVRGNLRGGAMYLKRHYDRTGDWTRALTRYNGRGPKARAYAERVLRAWEAGE